MTTTIIVGGVAGGASCAARLRRLDAHHRIIIVERGPHVSFANCGLPYYVGSVIDDERKLLVTSPQSLTDRFALDVRVHTEATHIDAQQRLITLHDLATGRTYQESYDNVVLSPGAAPLRPPFPGHDLPQVYTIRNVPDAMRVRQVIDANAAQPLRAVVVGGGFIGMEMAENLRHRDVTVDLIEGSEQIMPPLDRDMAGLLQTQAEAHGVRIHLRHMLSGVFSLASGGVRVEATGADGEALHVEADMVVLAIGVRPESSLAKAAGCDLAERGHIIVDAQMRTSQEHIFAVGDAVQIRDVVSGQPTAVPLAGPANRQGRVAADVIVGRSGRSAQFRGTQATAVLGAFGLTAATTGLSLKQCRSYGIEHAVVRLHPGDHVGYYPGATPIHLQLCFHPRTRRILGAQAVGEHGVDKRIDVIAMAIQMQATVDDLAESELCYAPQFGAAKDAVNLAGMIAANHCDGIAPVVEIESLDSSQDLVVDVRPEPMQPAACWPQAQHIPLTQLRDRMHELPKDRPLAILCNVGQTAHNATCLLRQHGFDARTITGGERSLGLLGACQET
ncbi:MAG: CoA-disulfide reductase [Planctomycetota bacterium]|nr:MAG: CoA-disulfide reductase [Planctomycetota bacterium]